MKLLILAAAFAGATSMGGPTAAEFNAALVAACPDHRATTRNISCTRPDQASIQFSCQYEMQGADGSWASHEAVLQQAEGAWVWIDGPTLCDEEEPSLN